MALPLPTDHVPVAELVANTALALDVVVAGAGALQRSVKVPRIQKPGLALSGWPEQLHAERVLVLGGTEIDYLEAATPAQQALGLQTLLASQPACIVVCRGRPVPTLLGTLAQPAGIAVLSSALVTAEFIAEVTSALALRLAPAATLHGVLLDVLGVGVLVTGKSGIGKSETALDLVVRGHRLIADDVVLVRRDGLALTGRGARNLGYHMEIRGIGIINIKDLFGAGAVREEKRVELVVDLVEWADDATYDRLGVDDEFVRLLEVPVPRVQLPVRPGRNLAILIEVAARNQLLKEQGLHSARAFRDALNEQLHKASGGT